MAYAYEEKALDNPHKLTLDSRNRLTMTGVTEVESFDEEMVVLHTTKGTLVIRGQAASAAAESGRRAGSCGWNGGVHDL